jgi:hypothetical protein
MIRQLGRRLDNVRILVRLSLGQLSLIRPLWLRRLDWFGRHGLTPLCLHRLRDFGDYRFLSHRFDLITR